MATHRVFSSGQLIDPVLASMSIPLLFKPVKIDGEYYADGGIMKNLPASSLSGKCDFIIGSHVNHLEQNFKVTNTMELLERCIRIGISNTIVDDIPLCNIFIDPKESGEYSALSFKLIDELIDVGYLEALRVLKDYEVVA
ncbi:MAG: patatin-like phospholipase family protein [Saprospiraceae bacterium]